MLILAVGGAGYAYYRGYGWPTQQSVVQDIFNAKAQGTDIGRYVSSSVSSTTLQQISNSLPSSSAVTINGVDQSMTHSTVKRFCEPFPTVATLTTPLSLSVMVLVGRLQAFTTSYVSQNNQNSGTTSGTNGSNSGTTSGTNGSNSSNSSNSSSSSSKSGN